MRISPLLHPLAVLRTTAGLTQKEMGDLVNRAARTIQSIELRKLPLTEELAVRIAEATGVDEAWLFAGDPNTPPRKGLTLIQAGRGRGHYTKADYEYLRAYLETPIFTKEEMRDAVKMGQIPAGRKIKASAVALQKSGVLQQRQKIVNLIDSDLGVQLKTILIQTSLTDDMRLVRWKIRRFLEDLAREFSLNLMTSSISMKTLEIVQPIPPEEANLTDPVRRPNRKAKP